MSETGKIDKPENLPASRYDYVGHLEYPNDKKITDLVFYNNPKKSIWTVKRGKSVISQRNMDKAFVDYLRSVGYEVKQTSVPAPNSHRSIYSLSITCDNQHCDYFTECYCGECKIKVKASVEKLGKNDSIVLVSFKARDIDEVVTKRKCLTKQIKHLTGIEGLSDVYGKMELC